MRFVWSIALLLFCFPCFSQGIKFEENLSWREIKEKAKNENKYIFLDAYATWCVPCKKMDKEVYNSDTIGRFFNDNFLSIKVQMDQTKSDPQEIRNRNSDAKLIADLFQIKSYPSYLFFNPQGDLVHREEGFKEQHTFKDIARQALDPQINLEGMARKYKGGNISNDELRMYAILLNGLGQKEQAVEVAQIYKSKFLDKLSYSEVIRKEYLEFVSQFSQLIRTKDIIFKYIYEHPEAFGKVFNDEKYPASFIDYVIRNEYVQPYLLKNGKLADTEPDWETIYAKIRKHFSSQVAYRIVLNVRLSWHVEKKEWKEAVQAFVKKTDILGIDTANEISMVIANNGIYDIILIHGEKADVEKGIQWMELLLKRRPENYKWMDTYASLLYKNGRIENASRILEKAESLAMIRKDTKSIELYNSKLKNIQGLKPIW